MCGSRHIRTNLTLFCFVRTKKPRTVRGFEMNCKRLSSNRGSELLRFAPR